jgi:hypothetical protein
MGYIFWYGYHVPAVRKRDLFYEKLEKERLAKYGGIPHLLCRFVMLFLDARGGLVCGRELIGSAA